MWRAPSPFSSDLYHLTHINNFEKTFINKPKPHHLGIWNAGRWSYSLGGILFIDQNFGILFQLYYPPRLQLVRLNGGRFFIRRVMTGSCRAEWRIFCPFHSSRKSFIVSLCHHTIRSPAFWSVSHHFGASSHSLLLSTVSSFTSMDSSSQEHPSAIRKDFAFREVLSHGW